MANNKLPVDARALRIGSLALGALAVGAFAMGAMAIGAVTIGRFAIDRSRIRRLEIDQLIVGSVHVKDSLTMPNIRVVENNHSNDADTAYSNRPTKLDRAVNKFFGLLVALGLALPHNYLLQVRGRKSGRLYSTPVDVLFRDGNRYVVAPRGYTQWVRNAVASGTLSLNKGGHSEQFAIRLLSDDEKPEILKSYLDRYKLTVQRYFPISAGSPSAAFRPFTRRYPVFELLPQ